MTSALGQKLRHYFVECGVPTLHQKGLPITKDLEWQQLGCFPAENIHTQLCTLVREGCCAGHDPTVLETAVYVCSTPQNITASLKHT